MKTRTKTRSSKPSGKQPTEPRGSEYQPPDFKIGVDLVAGDSFTVVSGREVFPYKGGAFEVGPLKFTATVRKGESAEAAFFRVWSSLQILFQAEFDTKFKQYKARYEQCED